MLCTLTPSRFSPSRFSPSHYSPSRYSPSSQLTRDKKSLEDKLQETQSSLEGEENKSKTEHRSRLKLESSLQELDEKLDRDSKVRHYSC